MVVNLQIFLVVILELVKLMFAFSFLQGTQVISDVFEPQETVPSFLEVEIQMAFFFWVEKENPLYFFSFVVVVVVIQMVVFFF